MHKLVITAAYPGSDIIGLIVSPVSLSSRELHSLVTHWLNAVFMQSVACSVM